MTTHTQSNEVYPQEQQSAFPASDKDSTLASLLGHCSRFLNHRIDGRRGQMALLAQIGENPGIAQKALAQQLEIQPASISELLAKLERKGLILREKDETDRRITRVSLTEAGKAIVGSSDAADVDPFQALTAEEQAQLQELLAKLLADWKQRCPSEHRRHSHGMQEGHRHDGHHDGHGHHNHRGHHDHQAETED